MSENVNVRCNHCGEIIGVYEPLITLMEGQALETSRAVEPLAGAMGTRIYHRACYEHHHGELRPVE